VEGFNVRRLALFAGFFSAAVFFLRYIPVPAAVYLCVAAGAALFAAARVLRPARRSHARRVQLALRRGSTLLAACALLAGALWCALFGWLLAPARAYDGQDLTVTATALDYPDAYGYGAYVKVSLQSEGFPRVKARLYIPNAPDAAELRPGEVFETEARFTATFLPENESLSSAAAGDFLTGYAYGDTVRTEYRPSVKYFPQELTRALGTSIDRVFPEVWSPLIRAITLGDRSELRLDAGLYRDLGLAGIAHIVAVSGMHVSFLISMAGLILRDKRRLALLGIPILTLFMAVTGFAAPVTRAVLMQSLVLLAPLANRKSDGVTSVFAALLALLLVNPYAAGNVGLQLSFLSTLGLILFTGRLDRRLTQAAERRKFWEYPRARAAFRFLCANLCTTAGALALSTPLLAYYFGYVSVVAPLTNLVTLFAASALFCLGLLAALLGLFSQMLGAAAAGHAAIPAWWITSAARALAKLPFAAVYVSNRYVLAWGVYVYAMLAAFLLTRARLRIMLYPACAAVCAFCLALLLTAASARPGLEVTALNVGQGQSIALTDGAQTALIDCGALTGDASAVAEEFLQARGVLSLGLVILTHFHADHAGGVADLLSRHRADALVIPDPALGGGGSALADEIIALANLRGIDIIYVTEPIRVTFGSTALTVYPPLGAESENEAGLTIIAESLAATGASAAQEPWRALITGDMNAASERMLTETYALPKITLYVVGHHGSRFSTSEELLDAAEPEAAVVSVGTNTFGHPAGDTLERLAREGIPVLRTDVNGTVTFRANEWDDWEEIWQRKARTTRNTTPCATR
jgi:competence protein ComEC